MKKTLLLLLSPLSLCASEFPAPYNSEPDQSMPMPAAEAAAMMRLPPGFKATVFAAEPDGAPEVLLDGLTGSPDMYHTFANGLRFGPGGWLYGRCGASSAGEVGVPGPPAEQRIPLRGTMWRYHPRRKVVEVLSSGTTNPWGHDWNEHGELFFINT